MIFDPSRAVAFFGVVTLTAVVCRLYQAILESARDCIVELRSADVLALSPAGDLTKGARIDT